MPTAQPGSRRPARRRRTDERIAAAVMQLLRQGGMAAVTMDSVSGASGVSKVTLYSRYGDRLEMLEGVGEQIGGSALRDAIDGDRRMSREFLEDALDILRQVLTDRVGPVFLADLLVGTDDVITIWRDKLVRPEMDTLSQLFSRGVDEGVLSPDVDHGLIIELILGGLVVGGAMHDGVPDSWAHDLATTLWPLLAV